MGGKGEEDLGRVSLILLVGIDSDDMRDCFGNFIDGFHLLAIVCAAMCKAHS